MKTMMSKILLEIQKHTALNNKPPKKVTIGHEVASTIYIETDMPDFANMLVDPNVEVGTLFGIPLHVKNSEKYGEYIRCE